MQQFVGRGEINELQLQSWLIIVYTDDRSTTKKRKILIGAMEKQNKYKPEQN